MKQSFTEHTIALPESRQLDVLAELFQKRGATVLRCPLVTIHNSPNKDAIEHWLKSFIAKPPDYFIILTGEGIKRLSHFAETANVLSDWTAALAQTHKIARGPKPNRALKDLGLQADALALQPTTEGMIQSLEQINLKDKSLAVQLYGEDPNTQLQEYLQSRNAHYNTVAPYIYASDSDTGQVLNLIEALADNKIDIICFTSKAQFSRLQQVAKKYELVDLLNNGLQQARIAAVGPVVANQLQQAGYTVAVMPKEKYFMKPMVSAVENLLCCTGS